MGIGGETDGVGVGDTSRSGDGLGLGGSAWSSGGSDGTQGGTIGTPPGEPSLDCDVPISYVHALLIAFITAGATSLEPHAVNTSFAQDVSRIFGTMLG